MDESRKKFLEWFGEEFESINNSEELHVQAIKMIAWQSWVKSRAAIEIKWPSHGIGASGGTYHRRDDMRKELSAAGIKVKE
ncbi:TPA: hypothetical protein ACIO69_003713 [Salmonella enterica subsp. enterica serovar Virchow]